MAQSQRPPPGACESINGALDEMLNSIETGYTGNTTSQLSDTDVLFIHRLVVNRILAGLPGQVHSPGDVATLSASLNTLASNLFTVASARFSKHGAHSPPGTGPSIP